MTEPSAPQTPAKNRPAGTRPGRPPPAAAAAEDVDPAVAEKRLREQLARIGHTLLVMSGKGGVGKSTVAVNLAVALALAGRRVGLLDVDIHGPSVPKLLRLEDAVPEFRDHRILPVDRGGLKVMSIGFLLQRSADAVIWRGPMKMGVIRQFLQDVEWGDLDYLVIDAPPGTGDEPLSVAQLAGAACRAVLVTTPQAVATADVRRSVTFCQQLEVPVLGVVENMSGFACPHCGTVTDIFRSGGGERLAREVGVPFLGRIPIDHAVGEACDEGQPVVYHLSATAVGKAFLAVADQVLAALEPDPATATAGAETSSLTPNQETPMRIAIPIADGKLSLHFGHCQAFALVDVNPATKTILAQEEVPAPEHQPGLLPRWLAERGAQVILAGGMGQRAQSLFAEQGIRVLVGAPCTTPEELVRAWLAGTLESGANVCDH